MRRTFATELLARAKQDKNIVVLTMDLGYGMWDAFRNELPEQFFNVGSSEQAGVTISVGMALEGKTVFIYSITPFLLFRAAETIRNYINHESIPCKLIASGRDKDYVHDGWSHDGSCDKQFMQMFPNVKSYWPQSKEEIPDLVDAALSTDKPFYINLKR